MKRKPRPRRRQAWSLPRRGQTGCSTPASRVWKKARFSPTGLVGRMLEVAAGWPSGAVPRSGSLEKPDAEFSFISVESFNLCPAGRFRWFEGLGGAAASAISTSAASLCVDFYRLPAVNCRRRDVSAYSAAIKVLWAFDTWSEWRRKAVRRLAGWLRICFCEEASRGSPAKIVRTRAIDLCLRFCRVYRQLRPNRPSPTFRARFDSKRPTSGICMRVPNRL